MPARDFNARVPTMTDTASAAHTHSTRLRMVVSDCALRPLVMATITRLSFCRTVSLSCSALQKRVTVRRTKAVHQRRGAITQRCAD